MSRRLNEEEIARLKKEHIRLLNEYDRQDQARKDTAASYREILKDLRTNEAEVRHMLETGHAVPEQMSLIPLDDPDDDTTITFETPDGKSVTTTPGRLNHLADNIHKIK